MRNTRFMDMLFSNTDPEVAKQVDEEIQDAERNGVSENEELRYENTGDGVAITDKGTGEVTLAQRSEEDPETYDLAAVPNGNLERYLHPSADGVTPSDISYGLDEDIRNHLNQYNEDDNMRPTDERQFSISSNNAAWQGIFSYPQEMMDRLFSETNETAEMSKVGDLKIEKDDEEDNTVIVTSESTGDQCRVTLDGDEMEVEELDSKNFSGALNALYIVGVQPYDHLIVDAHAYTVEAAQALRQKLEEQGVESIEVFEDQEEARDYAYNLLKRLGAEPTEGDVDEPVLQKEYSDAVVYTSSYNTEDSVLMSRLYSENQVGVTDLYEAVEEAIKDSEEGGETVELPDGVEVTAVDDKTAIIEEDGEFTKAIMTGRDMVFEKIEEDEAEELLEEAEEKKFSDIMTDVTGTRFFSQHEYMNSYMTRLFSEEADQNYIEEALEEGQQIENDDEIITPVSDDVAVVEDKDTGEFTKVTVLDEDQMQLSPITKAEAEDLLEDVEVDCEGEDCEKKFSDVYSDEYGTRFFSSNEYMTNYMVRLFSDEGDEQEIVEDALEKGHQIENEDSIVTPVSDTEVVIEDKETGEFTKAELLDEDHLNVEAISEKEAEELLEDVEIGEEKDEKKFSDLVTNEYGDRFFSQNEYMNNYMVRLFSEEADEEQVVDAIENGQQIENDDEIITPISEDEAVIKDKETGEYTHAELDDDDNLEVNAISKSEAKELLEDVKVGEKKYSSLLGKFFADAGIEQQAQGQLPPPPHAQQGQAPQGPMAPQGPQPAYQEEPQPTLEDIEDKAQAAIETIKAAAEEASAQILNAKATPAADLNPEIQEAQFSERTFSFGNTDTLVSWLRNK